MYKDNWTPDIDDGLDGRIEKENCFDDTLLLSSLAGRAL